MSSSYLSLTDLDLAPRGTRSSGNVTMDIVYRLGSEIVAGRILPGSILPNEAALSTMFGSGRSAIREALKMLAAKGLIDSRQRRGTRVRDVRDWNLLDSDILYWLRHLPPNLALVEELLELRLGFEPEAASLAARRGDDADLAAVRAAYRAMAEAEDGRRDPVEPDCRFHEAILAATGNRFYQPFANLVRTALSLTAPITNALFDHKVGDLQAHEAVLLAIEARESALARDRMRSLLGGVIDAVARADRLPDQPRHDPQSELVIPPSR